MAVSVIKTTIPGHHFIASISKRYKEVQCDQRIALQHQDNGSWTIFIWISGAQLFWPPSWWKFAILNAIFWKNCYIGHHLDGKPSFGPPFWQSVKWMTTKYWWKISIKITAILWEECGHFGGGTWWKVGVAYVQSPEVGEVWEWWVCDKDRNSDDVKIA